MLVYRRVYGFLSTENYVFFVPQQKRFGTPQNVFFYPLNIGFFDPPKMCLLLHKMRFFYPLNIGFSIPKMYDMGFYPRKLVCLSTKMGLLLHNMLFFIHWT